MYLLKGWKYFSHCRCFLFCPHQSKCLPSSQVWYRLLLEATSTSRQRRSALRRGSSTSHLHLTSLDSSSSTSTSPHPRAPGSLDSTDPASTPPSSLTSSHKFSTTASSGSGCGSSVSSSPGLPPSLPPWSPRSRLSLVESPRRLLQGAPKTRYSLCMESQEGSPHSRVLPPKPRATPPPSSSSNRRSLCLPDSLSTSRTSLLSLTPRNPLLELLENDSSVSRDTSGGQSGSGAQQPSTPQPPAAAAGAPLSQPRSRASLSLFRNSHLFH